MGWTGSGTVQRTDGARTGATVWQQADAAGVNIEADDHDVHDEDLALAIAKCLNRDGENAMAADLAMGSFKITGLAAGSAAAHAAPISQIQGGATLWGGTSGGTGNAQTISLTPAIGSYTTGLRFQFIAGATSTTTTPTLNINSLGAKTLKFKDGSAVKAGALKLNNLYTGLYDGTNIRILDADGWMGQETYNRTFRVGFVMVLYVTDDPNTDLPGGVTATWTEIADTDRYMRINSGGTPGGTGGTDTRTLPSHVHNSGSLATSATTLKVQIATTPDTGTVPHENHTHDITGDTGNPTTDPTISITPKFRDYRAWRRTA